jgi:pyruvate/2-oxoglutarate dehydrogenase complex dihydrolipoamide acyltransferase (E2) component
MDVIMPQLGETVAEGVVTKWYKKVGDAVKADEVLFDVETDKVSTEIPAPATGVVAEILVDEGVPAKVGARLAVIRESGAAAAATGRVTAAAERDGTGAQRMSPTTEHADAIAKPPLSAPEGGAQSRLSPVVRKLIAQHGLDAGAIRGTGRDGRITREDVTAHMATSPSAPARSRTAPRL